MKSCIKQAKVGVENNRMMERERGSEIAFQAIAWKI